MHIKSKGIAVYFYENLDPNHRYLIIPRWLTSNHRPIYKVKPGYLLQM